MAVNLLEVLDLGQEFEAFAVTTAEDIARLEETARLFLEINLGGTAIGTGINADPRYPALAVAELRAISNLDLVTAANLVEADHLIILTDQAGLYEQDPRLHSEAELIKEAPADDEKLDTMAGDTGGLLGRGGMDKAEAEATADAVTE